MPTIDELRAAFTELPVPAKPIASIFGAEICISPIMPNGFIGIRGANQTVLICPNGQIITCDNDRFGAHWRGQRYKSPDMGRFDGVPVSEAMETLKAELKGEVNDERPG